MIDIDGADRYFSESSFYDQWTAYSAEQRKRAIASAKRELSRALGRALDENEQPYASGDATRDEYACYEQALYLLSRDVLPSGTGSAVPSLNPDEAKETRTVMSEGKCPWSKAAMAWLGELRVASVSLG